MRLLVFGVSHHTATIELRERLAIAPADLPAALARLTAVPVIGEGVLLSTCNRTEAYVTCRSLEDGHETLLGFLAAGDAASGDALRPHVYLRSDGDAARHLFRVAAGLDSLVVGEPQILGQVKQAYSTAAERDCTGALLNRLFHSAFTAGKRVRSETGLAEGAVSVSYAALGLARKICGDLARLTVLIVGAGDMAELTARHLAAQKPASMLVSSRTLRHATTLAEEVDGTVVPWADLDRALAAADVVVTATGATQPIITRARVAEVMRGRRERPLFLIDIAVPRDVEAAAGSLEQVFLYNIDDLQSIVSDNLARRGAEMQHAEAIVNEEVEAFLAWSRSRSAMPTVVALRQRFEHIRQAELVRLQPRLAALPPDARARVDEITRLIVEKLLITPTEQLKSLADRDVLTAYADALSHLFALGPDEERERNDAGAQERDDADVQERNGADAEGAMTQISDDKGEADAAGGSKELLPS
jgi:glutamyl-tRNA reductase